MLAALNGVLGEHLAATDNPLAIAMRLRRDGVALALAKEDLRAAIPAASGRIVVLVHGLAMNDLQWNRQGQDIGAALVGCDGVRSVVRQALVGDAHRVSGHVVYRAVVPRPDMPEGLRWNAAAAVCIAIWAATSPRRCPPMPSATSIIRQSRVKQ